MIQVIRETHDTPQFVADALRVAGGVNRLGEPNYRCVWGWNRLEWIGGKWEDRDEHGVLLREVIQLRQEPKYFPVNRWFIERWMPPEHYGSPRNWYQQTLEVEGGYSIPALGPYPSRGEYEHCFTLETAEGEFLQLTPAIARHAALVVEASRLAGNVKRKEALEDRTRREDREYDSYADSVLS